MDVEKVGGHSPTSTLTNYIPRNRASVVLLTTATHAVVLSTMETTNQTKMYTFALDDKAMYTGQDQTAKCGSKQRSDNMATLYIHAVYCQFHLFLDCCICTEIRTRINFTSTLILHGRGQSRRMLGRQVRGRLPRPAMEYPRHRKPLLHRVHCARTK